MQPQSNQPGQHDLEEPSLGGPPFFVLTGPCSIFLLLAGARWAQNAGWASGARLRSRDRGGPRLAPAGGGGRGAGVIRPRGGAGWRDESRSGSGPSRPTMAR